MRSRSLTLAIALTLGATALVATSAAAETTARGTATPAKCVKTWNKGSN